MQYTLLVEIYWSMYISINSLKILKTGDKVLIPFTIKSFTILIQDLFLLPNVNFRTYCLFYKKLLSNHPSSFILFSVSSSSVAASATRRTAWRRWPPPRSWSNVRPTTRGNPSRDSSSLPESHSSSTTSSTSTRFKTRGAKTRRVFIILKRTIFVVL